MCIHSRYLGSQKIHKRNILVSAPAVGGMVRCPQSSDGIKSLHIDHAFSFQETWSFIVFSLLMSIQRSHCSYYTFLMLVSLIHLVLFTAVPCYLDNPPAFNRSAFLLTLCRCFLAQSHNYNSTHVKQGYVLEFIISEYVTNRNLLLKYAFAQKKSSLPPLCSLQYSYSSEDAAVELERCSFNSWNSERKTICTKATKPDEGGKTKSSCLVAQNPVLCKCTDHSGISRGNKAFWAVPLSRGYCYCR